MRIELTTCGLQNRCSAVELRQQGRKRGKSKYRRVVKVLQVENTPQPLQTGPFAFPTRRLPKDTPTREHVRPGYAGEFLRRTRTAPFPAAREKSDFFTPATTRPPSSGEKPPPYDRAGRNGWFYRHLPQRRTAPRAGSSPFTRTPQTEFSRRQLYCAKAANSIMLYSFSQSSAVLESRTAGRASPAYAGACQTAGCGVECV